MPSDVSPEVAEWVAVYAARLGVEPPSDEMIAEILDLAGVAARSSARQAAPIACWLAASAGVSPAEGRRLADAD
jgi:hypothetical protein